MSNISCLRRFYNAISLTDNLCNNTISDSYDGRKKSTTADEKSEVKYFFITFLEKIIKDTSPFVDKQVIDNLENNEYVLGEEDARIFLDSYQNSRPEVQTILGYNEHKYFQIDQKRATLLLRRLKNDFTVVDESLKLQIKSDARNRASRLTDIQNKKRDAEIENLRLLADARHQLDWRADPFHIGNYTHIDN